MTSKPTGEDKGAYDLGFERGRTDGWNAALEYVVGVLFEKCQPSNGDLFCELDDVIAEAKK